jgi:hypothetical protein
MFNLMARKLSDGYEVMDCSIQVSINVKLRYCNTTYVAATEVSRNLLRIRGLIFVSALGSQRILILASKLDYSVRRFLSNRPAIRGVVYGMLSVHRVGSIEFLCSVLGERFPCLCSHYILYSEEHKTDWHCLTSNPKPHKRPKRRFML